MDVNLRLAHGLRNDLLVSIDREELEEVHLHVAYRERLLAQPGMPRHREATPQERDANRACKVPVEEHLAGLGLLDPDGRPLRRVVAVGNRNLGNNHGVVAWQSGQDPPLLHVREDPLNQPTYSCLVAWKGGGLDVLDLDFSEAGSRVHDAEGDRDLTDQIAWAASGQRVLRRGRAVNIEAIIDQFYDIRHVLAYDASRPEGRKIAAGLYRDYPGRFRENALHAWRELGVPRNRYLHHAVGLSRDAVTILQREGTPEEVAYWLAGAGAEDALILDNGGSVACWAWWIHPGGGLLFAAPDYRPRATSMLAFVLRGPVRANLPGGSVSYSAV